MGWWDHCVGGKTCVNEKRKSECVFVFVSACARVRVCACVFVRVTAELRILFCFCFRWSKEKRLVNVIPRLNRGAATTRITERAKELERQPG